MVDYVPVISKIRLSRDVELLAYGIAQVGKIWSSLLVMFATIAAANYHKLKESVLLTFLLAVQNTI